MNLDLVTKADLLELKAALIEEIRSLSARNPSNSIRPWLKNSEVRELLQVSSNTIQRLRVSGKLKSTKLGGVHYYRYEDLMSLMSQVK